MTFIRIEGHVYHDTPLTIGCERQGCGERAVALQGEEPKANLCLVHVIRVVDERARKAMASGAAHRPWTTYWRQIDDTDLRNGLRQASEELEEASAQLKDGTDAVVQDVIESMTTLIQGMREFITGGKP